MYVFINIYQLSSWNEVFYGGGKCRHKGIGHSSKGEQDGLFAKMRRSIGGAGISKTWITPGPWVEIGYVVTDATKWEVDPERDASDFDAGYYEKLLEKAWDESAFVFYTSKR